MNDNNSIATFEREIEEDGIVETMNDIPGMELYEQDLSGIGVIVNSKAEAHMVFHDVLFLVDSGVISPEMFEYVLVADDIPSPATIRDPDQEADAIAEASIDVKSHLTVRDKTVWKRIQAIATQTIGAAPVPEPGEQGEAWVWLIDNVHHATRALINGGHLVVNSHGKYLLPLPSLTRGLNLQQKEEITKEIAKVLITEFDIEASYFSTFGSNDIEAVPFYCGDCLDNRLIYNVWSEGLE